MIRRRRLWLTAAIVVIAVIAQFAFFQPVRDIGRKLIAGPVALVSSTTGGLRNSLELLRSIKDLSRENAELKQRNNQLQSQIAELTNVKNENAILKKDLRFSQEHSELTLLPATIVNYSPTSSYQAVTIDKGSHDGIVENQAVVSSGFLIGKIRNVSQETSEVWLLSNRSLLTPVILTGSNVTGILKGGIRGLVIDNIPIDTEVKKGELVVTSSLEGLYPAGLAVGQIEEVISGEEEIFVNARISSPINIANLRTLFVVK